MNYFEDSTSRDYRLGMALLFLAALIFVMATFAGYHFIVGLLLVGAAVAISTRASRAIFSLLGTPNSR